MVCLTNLWPNSVSIYSMFVRYDVWIEAHEEIIHVPSFYFVTNVLFVKPKNSKTQSFLKSGFKNNEK